ncbi:MAG TPA: hypothetical protein VIO64_06705 [Pseudobacteroides sp.]|uniref:hypothetical protein n=1 Tax=Pseudobacteroides sp. TaxID=1968840 RepID=UPI002F91E18E
MKQKITIQDLNSLTPEQKQNLNSLWKPEKFDHAVASICKDIINEVYEDYEFVIGDIKIYSGYKILLYDILSTSEEELEDSGSEEASINSDSDCSSPKGTEDNNFDEDGADEDQGFESSDEMGLDFYRPISFIKDECLPLLTIGQMIEILRKNSPTIGQFYLFADAGDNFCEIGNRSHSNDYGFDLESNELCDVLWELIKSTL